jgi:AcrR family transcriptional regulator
MFHENKLADSDFCVKFDETSCIMNSMTRTYRMKRRAESRDRTRQRIVDATIELHQSRGLSATSVDDIAKRAKVGKVTVYRHFPDDVALVQACSGRYFERHPFPDVEGWRRIADPLKRLRRGLRDTYRYHRETEAMMDRVLAEARNLPIMEPYHAHWRRGVEVLAEPWPATGRERRRLKAGLALALAFDTWVLLIREQRLTDAQAIQLMMRLTECGAEDAG